MITLYMQTFSAPVRAVLMTAEALGVKLQKKIVDLSKKEHLTEEFLKQNPQHTIPTLNDNGVIIWDSHAINAYLVSKYGKNDSLYPKDLAKRALVDQRLHFDSSAVFPWLRIISRAVKYKGQKALTEEQKEGLSDGFSYLESFLENRLWVAGDTITIADFSLISTVSTLNLIYEASPRTHPNVFAWLDRAQKLPFYDINKEGLERFAELMTTVLIKH